MNDQPSSGLRERVRAFIAENFYVSDAGKLADDTSLVESGIVDSTGILEVVAFLEREFGIQMADAEVIPRNLDSIANVADFVGHKQQAIVA